MTINFTDKEFRDMIKNSDVEVDGRFSVGVDVAEAGSDRSVRVVVASVPKMTETEKSFALDYLEPLVRGGEIILWCFEPSAIRVPGQSYTPDFFAVFADGTARFYEVKGKNELGSQSRSSAKFRWVSSVFDSETVQFYWAKMTESGEWSIKRKKPILPKHKQL